MEYRHPTKEEMTIGIQAAKAAGIYGGYVAHPHG